LSDSEEEEENEMEEVINTLSTYEDHKEEDSEDDDDTQLNATEADINKPAPSRASKRKRKYKNLS
jgi:hypothetical protein